MPEDYIGIEFTSYKTAPELPVLFPFIPPPPTDAARYRSFFFSFISRAVKHNNKENLTLSERRENYEKNNK